MFEDMFQADIGLDGSPSLSSADCSNSSAYMTYSESSSSNKRNSTEMKFGKAEDSSVFDTSYQNFCFGVSIYCIFLIFHLIYHISYIIHGIHMKNEVLYSQYMEIKLNKNLHYLFGVLLR